MAGAYLGICKADAVITVGEIFQSLGLQNIGGINRKTTAARLIPVPGKTAGDKAFFGGLLGQHHSARAKFHGRKPLHPARRADSRTDSEPDQLVRRGHPGRIT